MLFVTAVAGRIYLRYATRNHNSCTNVYQRQAGNLKQQAAGDEALGGYIRKAKCIFIRQKLNSTQDPYLTVEKNRCVERSMCKIFNMMLLSSLWTSRNSQRDLSSSWKGDVYITLKVRLPYTRVLLLLAYYNTDASRHDLVLHFITENSTRDHSKFRFFRHVETQTLTSNLDTFRQDRRIVARPTFLAIQSWSSKHTGRY